MTEQSQATSVTTQPIILVVDNLEESRNSIRQLLLADGYTIETARSESDAIALAARRSPQLILINLGSPPHEAVAIGRRIRKNGVDSIVPIVLFCVEWLADGENLDVGDNVYVAHPDNFNQLREFLHILLVAVGRPD